MPVSIWAGVIAKIGSVFPFLVLKGEGLSMNWKGAMMEPLERAARIGQLTLC